MKNFKFLAALCCMLAVFTACEKNEPNDNGVGIANGHEWVDLDLPSGLRWATCNVGATKPESYGYYLAWGETTTKTTYYWDTYKWCNGSYNTMIKYCTDSDYGTVDNKTVLNFINDVAYINLGGAWRMPTDSEWTELRNNCTWTWTTRNGVNGYTVKSKINGNSILLPAAGRCGREGRYNLVGEYGYYWSSSLASFSPHYAYCMFFTEDDISEYGHNCRFFGQSVRPVLK